MKARVSEKGDVMAVVFGILVVLLMAAVGVIFYQNFIAKKADTSSQPPSSEKSSDETLLTANVAYANDIYKMDYPESWEAEAKKPAADASGKESSLTITNPDKSIQVAFRVFEGSVDWACDTADGLKVRYYNVHSTDVKKLTGSSLYLVEAMSDLEGGGYRYDIGLAPDGGMTHASVGDSRCTVKNLGILTNLGTGQSMLQGSAKIEFPKLPNAKDSKVSSMDEIKDLLATDDYKAAVKTIESIRKE